ncbi:MAG TPA: hypothetical protein PK559_12830 [Ignavibacteriaceae bacterium]|nr:hypothetical protein [Ignavibacteriaceae bacterium]
MNILSIDIGSNTVSSLIANIDLVNKSLIPIKNFESVLRISEGLTSLGNFSELMTELLISHL